MLAFLLGLLKIIGIALLVILLVVLVLVAIVLFVPIRYQAEGTIDEEKKQAKARVTWLCKLVRLKLDYRFPDKPLISFKILWIELLKEKKPKKPKKEKQPKEPKEAKEKRLKKEKQKKEKYRPEVNDALLEAADAENKAIEAKNKDEMSDASKEEAKVNGASDMMEQTEENEAGDKIEKIIFKIQGLYDKINKIVDNIHYYLDILEEEETQGLIKDAWCSILKILNSIKPKIFRINAIIGFDMPDTTGRVYGYYCMLMPWLSDDINIEPDFEQKIINGDIYIKGKIRMVTIAVNGLRIVFDKRLKPLIKKIKNGGK